MALSYNLPITIILRFKDFFKRMAWWQRIVALALSLALLAWGIWRLGPWGRPQAAIKLAAVQRGELHREVTASGSLRARNTVEVGTQVSGTLVKILADYNSRVRRGQLLALLDTTFLHASVLDAEASYRKAQSQSSLAEASLKRSQALYQQKLISDLDWEQAEAQYQTAKAAELSAKAQWDRARINLSYAYIRSPIDGIVISRNVEVGQTVAASLNAPTLFVIADDLSKMQIMAMVDEGDIGKVAVGQRALFTVDAYPEKSFTGTVSKIYLQPTTVQNVVSYTAIVDLDNSDLSLMPGMTANVTIITDQISDALLVPAAALGFKPQAVKKKNSPPGQRAPRPSSASGSAPERASRHDRDAVIHVFQGRGLKPVPVKVLLNNGILAAVAGDLKEGDSVAVGYNNVGRQAGATSRSPFQQQPPPGMRRF